ncbi:MAG: response regulator transcription factor [Chloroflexi bacterium]|nr:response regulator transcription factor [Chloroflexota bacterium]
MPKLRVLLADDHAIVREGVRMILNAQPDLVVVGEASNGNEVLSLAQTLKPDLVVMDIGMPGKNGLEATRALKQLQPHLPIVILTMHEDEDYFFRVLAAGAAGYVLKGAGSDELLSAIRAIQQGGVYLYPTMAKKLVGDYLKAQGAAARDPLTPREREVLKLIAAGKTNREIAEALVLSLNTVQTHRLHLMEKLNLHNRTELIKYAIRRGLIEADE